jgi:hypothetical protein
VIRPQAAVIRQTAGNPAVTGAIAEVKISAMADGRSKVVSWQHLDELWDQCYRELMANAER